LREGLGVVEEDQVELWADVEQLGVEVETPRRLGCVEAPLDLWG